MLLIFWLGIKIYLSMSLSLLPQIWVKPLTTNAQVAYTVWDVTEAGYARVGEDIVYNTWNLLLLDLRSTASSGILKDAKGFKVEVGGWSKVILN